MTVCGCGWVDRRRDEECPACGPPVRGRKRGSVSFAVGPKHLREEEPGEAGGDAGDRHQGVTGGRAVDGGEGDGAEKPGADHVRGGDDAHCKALRGARPPARVDPVPAPWLPVLSGTRTVVPGMTVVPSTLT